MDKGLSGFDAALNERANVIYHIPSFNSNKDVYGTPERMVGLQHRIQITSGYAFNPTLAVNRSFTNKFLGYRPVRNLSSTYNASTIVTGNPNEWFDPTMFAIQPVGTYGNAPRDGIRAPWLQENVDFSLVIGHQG